MDEVPEPVTEKELQEFLEADRTGVRSSPVFKRRLRDRLWEIVQTKARLRRKTAAAPPERDPSGRSDPPDH